MKKVYMFSSLGVLVALAAAVAVMSQSSKNGDAAKTVGTSSREALRATSPESPAAGDPGHIADSGQSAPPPWQVGAKTEGAGTPRQSIANTELGKQRSEETARLERVRQAALQLQAVAARSQPGGNPNEVIAAMEALKKANGGQANIGGIDVDKQIADLKSMQIMVAKAGELDKLGQELEKKKATLTEAERNALLSKMATLRQEVFQNIPASSLPNNVSP